MTPTPAPVPLTAQEVLTLKTMAATNVVVSMSHHSRLIAEPDAINVHPSRAPGGLTEYFFDDLDESFSSVDE
jgi:hypothetical protein